jgi:glycosyltransferase involved in cell wall biosynthesis
MGKLKEQNLDCDTAVDIVVPTRGRGARINILVESVLESDYPNFTLWIVDQSEDDLTEEAIRPYIESDSRIRYERTPTCGSNIARNAGACLGDAPVIIFTDDDCRVTTGWLGAMVTEFEKDSSWAVFGRILPDERIQNNTSDDYLARMLPMAIKEADSRQVYEGNHFNLGFGHGANMGFRRECFELIHGFDNLLGIGGVFRSWPERDIGYRILVKGGRIVYTPDALLFHSHWRDWPAVRNTFRNYAFGTGATVAKYVRCGHWGAIYLLAEWMFSQGVRQILSGVIKWRSWMKVEVGLFQLIFPWIGIAKSLRFPINREDLLYQL